MANLVTAFPQINLPLVDPVTGRITREWLLLFINLFNSHGQGNSYSIEDAFLLSEMQNKPQDTSVTDQSDAAQLLAEFSNQQTSDDDSENILFLTKDYYDVSELIRMLTDRTLTASGTVTTADYYISLDTTSNNVTATLPPSAQMLEKEIVFTKISSPYIAYLAPQGSDLIIGQSLIEITEQWTSLTLRGKSGGYDIV